MKRTYPLKTFRGRITHEELQLWLDQHRLTKRELAARLGVSTSTITAWCSHPDARHHARTPIGLHDELVRLYGPPAPLGGPLEPLPEMDDPALRPGARKIADISFEPRGGPLRPHDDKRDLHLYIQLCRRQWLQGIELSEWMADHNVTEQDLADAAGVTIERVDKWLHDRPPPRKGLIALLVTRWGPPWPPVIGVEDD